MLRYPGPSRSMLPALAASSGLHLFAALLLGFLLAKTLVDWPFSSLIQTAAENRRPAIVVLERRQHQSPPPRRVVKPIAVAPAPPAEAPHFVAPKLLRRADSRQDAEGAVSVAPRHAKNVEPRAVAPAVEAAAPVASQAASPVPAVAEREAVQPSPSPIATQISDASAGGWGQNFASPLLTDESALDDLRAKYRGSVSVQVDETGRAVRVEISAGIPADARSEIEQRLLSLHYIPAECNGLRCAGTLRLTI